MESDDRRRTLAAAFRLALEYATDGLFRVLLEHQPISPQQSPAELRRIAQGVILGIHGVLQTGISLPGLSEELGARLLEISDRSDGAMVEIMVHLEGNLRTQIPSHMIDEMRPSVNRVIADMVRGWLARRQVLDNEHKPQETPVVPSSDTAPVADAIRDFFAQSPIALSIIDLQEMRYILYNPASERLFGYTVEEESNLSVHETRNAETADDDFDLFAELVAGDIPILERVSARPHKDGRSVRFHLLSWLIRDASGAARYMVNHLTEEKSHPDGNGGGLAEKRARYLRQISVDPIVIATEDGIIRFASPSVEMAFGHDPDWLVGKHMSVIVRESSYEVGQRVLEDVIALPRSRVMVELEAAVRDGSSRWFEVIATNLLDVDDVQGIVFQGRDITERRELRSQLELAARTEPLTGLLNRRGFLEELKDLIVQRQHAGDRSALMVCYIDLDDFKQVNDRFGHTAGDIVLTEVGRVLHDLVRDAGFAGRMGGDEFVLCVELPDGVDSEAFADRLTRSLTGMIDACGQDIAYSGTYGAVIVEGPSTYDADRLIGLADQELGRAKASGVRGRSSS